MEPSEFLDWKESEVTRRLFKTLEERIKEGSLILAGTAGANPVEDARLSGYLKAYSAILNIEVEDL